MKRLKKILKISGISLGVLLILLITLPFLFEGKIMKTAKEQINANLNANVDFESLNLSVLRHFPHISLGLNKLTVVGQDKFKSDTLVSFDNLTIVLNLMSVIKGDEIKIRSIILDKPQIYAKVLANGKANWDIAKPSADTAKTDTTAGETKFKLALKSFKINDGRIVYDDQSMKMLAGIKDLNFELSGDLTDELTSITNELTIGALTVVYENVKYLNKAKLGFNAAIDADLKNMRFTFKDNELRLNDLAIGFEGNIDMPKDDIAMDMKFGAKKTGFKEVLSLIPSVFMEGFEDLKTNGSFTLKGFVKGIYNEKTLPAFGLDLAVMNAMFQYPDLPKKVENINIKLNLENQGGSGDNNIIDISKFHVEMAQNPFDVTMNIRTTAKDVLLKGNFKGKLDLASIKDVIPLTETDLKGIITTDVFLAGSLSALEKEQYESFKANGKLDVKNFFFKNKDFPQGMTIRQTSLNFTPKFVELASFDALVGKSDIQLKGLLENYLPYVLRNQTVSGNLTVSSKYMNVNEFLGGSPSTETTQPDTMPLTAFEIPGNIDFRLNVDLQKILYDKLEISNVQGLIELKESKANLTGLKMNLLEGSLLLTGFYDAKDVQSPKVDFGMDLANVDIPKSFDAFTMIQKFAPIAKTATGKISLLLKYTSTLDNSLSPVLNTVNGTGGFKSKEIGLARSKAFELIADATKNEKYRNLVLKDVDVKFDLVNGQVNIKPFTTKIGNGQANISGTQGIDLSMNYTINHTFPRSDLGNAANSVIDGLASKAGINSANMKDVNLAISVGGTLTDPKIKLDMAQTKNALADAVKDKAQTELNKQKEEVKEVAKEEADKLKKQAEQKAKEEADKLKDDLKKKIQKLW